ncbi:MAG: hypothetical protein WCV83_00630 [Candidatus Magasanikbacteria bacterium]
MFIVGKKQKLLNELGIAYGEIHLEGVPLEGTLLFIENAKATLQAVANDGKIEEQEMLDILAQIEEAGVCQTIEKVFEKVSAYEFFADFMPAFRFAVCKDGSYPTPRGQIVREDGAFSKEIHSMAEGLEKVANLINSREVVMHVLDGIMLLKQMMAAGLPINDAPVDDRRPSIDMPFGPLGMTILDITLLEHLLGVEIPRRPR